MRIQTYTGKDQSKKFVMSVFQIDNIQHFIISIFMNLFIFCFISYYILCFNLIYNLSIWRTFMFICNHVQYGVFHKPVIYNICYMTICPVLYDLKCTKAYILPCDVSA